MSYKIFSQDGKFVVYKVDAAGQQSGEALGTHNSETEAKTQLQALNANESKEAHTKMWDEPMPSYGPVSFSEMERLEAAEEMSMNVQKLAYCFPQMAMAIMRREDITDKETALTTLAAEFGERVQTMAKTKERWQPLTDKAINLIGDLTKAATKTEDGVAYPASDFAYVPDANKPSEWKIRLTEGKPGNITKAQLGRAAAALSAGGFRGNQAQLPGDAAGKVKARIRREYEKLGVKADDMPESVRKETEFFIWKEAGQYHWLARYSNNIRDEDTPPEIISAKSHRRFVELVDKGAAPLPELWLWHIPEWRLGQATSVAYDDSGFAVAIGTVDKGCEPVAEWLAEQKEIAVSHGMPKKTISRDPDDGSIIVEHETREISPLFNWAAANKRTGFFIFDTKEDDMAIPAYKREELIKAGLAEAVLDALEAKNAAEAKEAIQAGLETKEQPAGGEPQVSDAVGTQDNRQTATLTEERIASAIITAFKPLADRLAALEGQVKELAQADDEKIKARAAAIPQASLESLITQSLFGKETQVDGRSTLAKSGPKETPAQTQEGPFFMQWIGGKQ